MKKTGELLKENRERANLSLGEVALATKINPKVLAAIEAGDVNRLPAKTFLKGFVKSYALFLKTDLEVVMALFTEETGGPTPPPVHEAYQKTDGTAPTARRGPPEESSSGMRTAAIVVIALLIGAIIGVRELIEKYQREKVVSSSELALSPLPASSGAATARTEAAASPAQLPTVAAAAVTASSETPAGTGSPAPASIGAPKMFDPANLAPPKATLAAAEIPKPNPTPVEPIKLAIETAVKSEPAPAAAAPVANSAKAEAEAPSAPKDAALKEPAAAKASHKEVILEAMNAVDIDFELRGQKKHISLGASDVHTIRADGPVVINLSDGGAVNLIVNGTERGVPGDAGKPKQVKLP